MFGPIIDPHFLTGEVEWDPEVLNEATQLRKPLGTYRLTSVDQVEDKVSDYIARIGSEGGEVSTSVTSAILVLKDEVTEGLKNIDRARTPFEASVVGNHVKISSALLHALSAKLRSGGSR